MDDKTHVQIFEEDNPVDIARYINYVNAPQASAIATFSGATRDTFDGKIVQELSGSPTRSCSIGGHMLFIADSSVHRVDALKSCRFLIDESKASVPMWKKEVYANGEVWKQNSKYFGEKVGAGKE